MPRTRHHGPRRVTPILAELLNAFRAALRDETKRHLTSLDVERITRRVDPRGTIHELRLLGFQFDTLRLRDESPSGRKRFGWRLISEPDEGGEDGHEPRQDQTTQPERADLPGLREAGRLVGTHQDLETGAVPGLDLCELPVPQGRARADRAQGIVIEETVELTDEEIMTIRCHQNDREKADSEEKRRNDV